MDFQFDYGLTPRRRRVRRARRVELHPSGAKQYALGLLRAQKVSALAQRVIDALAVAGVLSEQQLNRLVSISARTLVRYYKDHLLDRVSRHGVPLAAYGFEATGKLYTLGLAGLAIAAMRAEGGLVPTGYLGYGAHRVMHDLLTNEVTIRLAQRALDLGLKPVWHSKYEATVHDASRRPVLEPDALLVAGDIRLVLEYHNEPSAQRVARKLRSYESVHREGAWRQSWETETFPLVLVAFTHKAVATGYQRAVDEAAMMGLRCRFLGRSWESFMSGSDPALWHDFRSGKVVNVLTGEEVR